MAVALRAAGITRRFGDCVAVDDVGVELAGGEVHAIVGENGAGKSTLLSILYGETRADAGELAIAGRTVALAGHSPRAAIAAGVGMVHQHFRLVGPLSVAENVVLGREPRRGPLLDRRRAEREVAELSERLGLGVDPRRRVEDLSVGEQQRVELVKVLWRGASVLLLDEPTAVLAPAETGELFRVLGALAAEGKAVVLVTHRLDEVVALADRITVLRHGRVAARLARGASRAEVAAAVVGGEVESPPPAERRPPGGPLLEVSGLRVARPGGGEAVRGVSFAVHAGEILGVAGVQGNGQSELALALVGLLPASGSVRLGGRSLDGLGPRRRMAAGLGHIAEDRHLRGLVLPFSVEDNLILGRQREFAGALGLRRGAVGVFARDRIADLDIRPPDPKALAGTLSGGNQQKIVVARELSRRLAALVCVEPTRGVNIGASAAIHRRLRAARDAGVAVLLISSELAELRELADRVAVIYRGELAGVLPGGASDVELGELMTGARRVEAAR